MPLNRAEIIAKILGTLVYVGYALGFIFMLLKIIGTVGWSWWWVTAPFWTPVVLIAILVSHEKT